MKQYPDEWQHRLDSNHGFKGVNKEIKKIKDKLTYWLDPINKMDLIDVHGQKSYDKEIQIMQDKLK